MDYMKEFTISKWHGKNNYECNHCPFATVEGTAEILDHLRGTHFKSPPPSPILVADRSGKEKPRSIIEPAEMSVPAKKKRGKRDG